MGFKYTRHFLKKVESLLEAVDYTIRYEKGNFQSGYCIVENRKIAVINKFFDTEARINTLIDILATVEVDLEQLDEKQVKLYRELEKSESFNPSQDQSPSN